MHSKQRLFNIARFEHENEMRRKALQQKKKFGIRNPQGGIQNPRLSWIPLHGATEVSQYANIG